MKKQLPEVFYKKGVLIDFAKFTGKHLRQSLFLVKRLWRRCFPVNLAKNFKNIFFTEHFGASVHATAAILYPPKTSENLCFYVFRGYKKGH